MRRFAILSTIIAFTLLAGPIGCGSDDESSGINQANNTEPDGNNTEPDGNNTDPDGNNTEPDGNNTEPNNTEPNNTEPNNTEPNNTEPNNTEPNNTEPNNTEPNNTEPNNTEPNNTEPNNTEPNNTEPNNTEPNNDQPNNGSESEYGEAQGALHFIAQNDTDSPLYLQEATVDFEGPGAWVTLEYDGQELIRSPNCMPAYCDDPNDTPDCIDPEPEVAAISPGDYGEFIWDGYHYVVVEDGGDECTEAIEMTDEELWAELCYSQSIDDEDPDGPIVDSPGCLDSGNDPLTPDTIGQFILTVESG